MASRSSKRFWDHPAAKAVGAVLCILIGAFASPIATSYVDERRSPALETQQYTPDLSLLGPETLRQLSLITTNYSVRHVAGGPASNVSVIVEANEPIEPGRIDVDAGAEKATLQRVGPRAYQIDLEQMRPGTELRLTVFHAPRATVGFEVVSANARIESASAAGESSDQTLWLLVLSSVVLGLAIAVLGAMLVARGITSLAPSAHASRALAFVVAFAIIVNALIGLVPGQFFGRLPVSDVCYGVVLFFLLSNWQLLQKALAKAAN